MGVNLIGNRWRGDFYVTLADGRLKRFRPFLGPGVKSERQAEQEVQRLKARVENEIRANTPGSTTQELPEAAFSGFARYWYETYVLADCEPSVQHRYETIIRVHLVPYFGDRPISEITSREVQEFKSENLKKVVAYIADPTKQRQLSRKTINEHLCVLSSMFRDAVAWKYLRENPCTGVKRLKLGEREIRFYDAGQTAAFLAKAMRLVPEMYAFFATAFKTGMRLGELLGLEWGDLDFVRHQVHVRKNYTTKATKAPKNGKSRIIPMPDSLFEILQAHRHLKGPLVFCRPNGKHLTRDIVKRPFDRIARAAGLHRIRIHDMRHSYASQLVMAGVPMKAVAEYLGHSETRVTLVYAHVSPDARQSYVGVLDGKTLTLGALPGVQALDGGALGAGAGGGGAEEGSARESQRNLTLVGRR